MEDNLPLVTIFTLVYNTDPKYVIEAIDSIYAQTYKNIEHIVINDYPGDNVNWPVVKNYIITNNLPSIIIEHDKNYGLCKTLNQILTISKGEYICGCSDDRIFEDKVFNELVIFKNSVENIAAVYSDAYLVDHNSERISGYFIEKYRIFNSHPSGHIFELLKIGNFLPSMAMLFKKDKIIEVGGFDERLDYEDWDMLLRLFKKYPIAFNPNVSSEYRIHQDSLLHSNKIKWDYNFLLIYLKHLDVDFFRNKINKALRNVIKNNQFNQVIAKDLIDKKVIFKSKYLRVLVFSNFLLNIKYLRNLLFIPFRYWLRSPDLIEI